MTSSSSSAATQSTRSGTWPPHGWVQRFAFGTVAVCGILGLASNAPPPCTPEASKSPVARMSERMHPALKLPQFLQFQSLVHILVHIQAAVLSQKIPGQDGSGGSCLLIPEQENLLSLKTSLVYTEKLSVGGGTNGRFQTRFSRRARRISYVPNTLALGLSKAFLLLTGPV